MEVQRKADIIFRKSGRIDIKAHVSHALNLEPGDIINIVFDKDQRELYLYVSLRKNERKVQCSRFHNEVKATSIRSNRYLRVQSMQLCDFVNGLTGANESWLYVGNAKSVNIKGRQVVAIPLIWRNNIYKDDEEYI